MKKTHLALILVGALAALALATGCGSSAASSSAAASGATSSSAASAQSASASAADSGAAAEAEGDIVIGCSYIAANTNPIDSAWDLTSHGVSEGVYMQDASGNLVSRFISSLTRKDDLTWEAALTNAVKFSDGTDCDAQALADCMNYLQENNEMANGTAGKVKFTVKDANTLEIVTAKPTPVMQSLLGEWCNVVFKQDGDEFIYTGPYMVEKMDSEVSLALAPNPYYDDRAANRSNVLLKVFNDTATMQQAFESGEIDLMFGLTPEIANTLSGEGFTVKNYDAGYQYFAFTNIASGPMADADVRKAVDKIIDRDQMIQALGGGQVATGIFAHYYSFNGDVTVGANAEEAAKLLEGAGYAKDEKGLYAKDGETLKIKMITYSSRADLPILMQIAASNLTEAGIDVSTEIVDDINAALEGGKYDIALYAQHTAPSGEPSAFLNMALAKGGSRNYAGYENAEIATKLDEMGTTEPGAARDQISKDIQSVVAEDLPLIYLVDPQWHVALSDRVANYEPYCGDYYIVNAELGL